MCSYGQSRGRWTEGYNYTAKLTLPFGQKIEVDFFFFTVGNLSFRLTSPMLNNIVNNMLINSTPLHSGYPYQGGETVEALGILGIDGLQHVKLYSHEELWIHGKRAISSSFQMVIFHLEVWNYSCILANLKFFTRDC